MGNGGTIHETVQNHSLDGEAGKRDTPPFQSCNGTLNESIPGQICHEMICPEDLPTFSRLSEDSPTLRSVVERLDIEDVLEDDERFAEIDLDNCDWPEFEGVPKENEMFADINLDSRLEFEGIHKRAPTIFKQISSYEELDLTRPPEQISPSEEIVIETRKTADKSQKSVGELDLDVEETWTPEVEDCAYIPEAEDYLLHTIPEHFYIGR